MWGNLTGWIISAIVGLGLGFLLFYVAAPPTPTEPTNSSKLTIAKSTLALPVSPEVVVSIGTKDCDAGDMYRKAIRDYAISPSTYEKFNTSARMKMKESDLDAVGDILSARDCRSFHLFSKDLSQVVNYDNSEPAIDALKDTGTICCTLGLLYTNPQYNANVQPERAFQLWEAAFALGARMFDERLTFKEMVTGHDLMQNAGGRLAGYYADVKKDNARAARIQEFLTGESTIVAKANDAWAIIGGIDEAYGGKYAGDIFQIARSDKADPMFRVEALKHIGHYRFNAETMGDQLAAKKAIKVLMGDDKAPPAVKAAAKIAHDLTIEQHRMVGGGT